MKESNDILDRIELYTKGKMSFEEKLVFEKELASDNALQNQLEFSQIVDRMVIAGEALKLKEQMGKDLNKPKMRVWSYVAGFLFVVATIAGMFLFLNKKEEKPKVINQVSDYPKVNKQVEIKQIKKIEYQNATSSVKIKTIDEQEKKASTSTSLPEPKTIFIEPNSPIQIPVAVSKSGQTVDHSITANVPAKVAIIQKDICVGFFGEVEFSVVPSCKGQETGEVYMKAETVKGGKAPFLFSIGNKSSHGSFNNLTSGQHSLSIKDANGCAVENTKKIVIGEKNCLTRKEYVFNPEYDPSWPIPYDTDKKAVNFLIHEKSGKVFFQSTVFASQPAEWKGETNTGLTLGVGLYFFTIEYADGSVDEGSIVVSR